jgi:hypothetical protein
VCIVFDTFVIVGIRGYFKNIQIHINLLY